LVIHRGNVKAIGQGQPSLNPGRVLNSVFFRETMGDDTGEGTQHAETMPDYIKIIPYGIILGI